MKRNNHKLNNTGVESNIPAEIRTSLLAFLFPIIFTSLALSQPQNFIRGVDVSFLDQIENNGGVFKENGIPEDALLIFHDHGINYVRLRLWHTPPGGHNNLQQTLLMAERVKQRGMKLLLDLHFSDSWADPGTQSKPAAWTGLSFPHLKDSVYQYARNVLTAMRANNTLPDMVQIGNEITCGILWNDGRVCDSDNTPLQWSQLAELLNEGIRGVRESLSADDTVRIMLHIDRGADSAGSRWFLDNLQMHSVPYDVIGLSYYPWWHGGLDQVAANLQMLSLRYNKDILLVETAYPWTLAWNDTVNNIVGLPSQLLPGYPATVKGQQTFLTNLISLVQATPNDRGIGIVYWSPEYISAPTLGSPVENLALFDFGGEVLGSMYAFEPPTIFRQLLAYYPFSGSAVDSSVNGNHGIVNGAALSIDRFGNSSSAYHFNGVNNSIEVHRSTLFNSNSTHEFTFSGWIRINSFQHQVIGFSGAANGPPGYFSEWAVMIEPDRSMRFRVNQDAQNLLYSYLETDPVLDLQVWSHVTATWKGATGEMKLYLNAIEVGSLSNAVNEMVFLPAESLHLGFVGDGPLDGTLDDVRLYNYALTPAEVDSLYHVGGWPTITSSYAVGNSWNLLSVPLTVSDPTTAVLFPTAISSAFTYEQSSGYVARDTLQNTKGYWLKFPASQNVSIGGSLRERDTVHVIQGWNIVGTISSPVDTLSVQQDPPGILLSPFYEYSGNYGVADTLWPARGYWVKAGRSGSIILSTPAAPQQGNILPKTK